MADRTEKQSDEDRNYARSLSERRTRPPTELPGYQAERCLGAGTYGEVWVARDVNTGKLVALKFFTRKSGGDWSLLAREVEKLAFLAADRYVVQLIEVGWEADPPYYVMEYVEGGSLDDRLGHGPLPAGEAVPLFREIALSLVHAHGKGILHCDLKPANVLLDLDHRPRLADFGQARLTSEQNPSLGTMFYMAPEQADLTAEPDARWDVYGLGALLFCMLVGRPPYKTEESQADIESGKNLKDRLKRYRRLIKRSPAPTEHRKAPGAGRMLPDIIDRCLAADPRDRYPNAQAMLDDLDARDRRRARLPFLILGALIPAVLLMVMAFFGFSAFQTAVDESEKVLVDSKLQSNQLLAEFAAGNVAREFDRRWRILEQEAADAELQALVRQCQGDPAKSPAVPRIHAWLKKRRDHYSQTTPTTSWFVARGDGAQLGRSPEKGAKVGV
ncbi:MAG: serine/threonine protein kinase, partial [Planctomycetales bacterium]